METDLPFDLLIMDIDGVLTDGTEMYDRDGKVFGKVYCDLDFTAIKRFRAAGIRLCFLSGDQTVNKAMAEYRKVDFHYCRGINKVDMLPGIRKHYAAKKVAYVGDDIYDIPILAAVEISFCPRTSPSSVKNAAMFTVPIDAGKGVLAGIYDMFEEKGMLPCILPKDSDATVLY